MVVCLPNDWNEGMSHQLNLIKRLHVEVQSLRLLDILFYLNGAPFVCRGKS